MQKHCLIIAFIALLPVPHINYGLRDYGVEGQIGLEASPQEYVDTLVGIFRELRRVLRDDGTVWINLGDSYCGYKGKNYGINPENSNLQKNSKILTSHDIGSPHTSNLKPKDLMMIPARVALALQADGWYLRSDIIWAKKNPMPESVKDRPTKAHEYIFLLSKSPRYYYDQEAIREPLSQSFIDRWQSTSPGRKNPSPQGLNVSGVKGESCFGGSENGRNCRTVWEVSTKPYPEAHFATFPPDLIRPCILAGCPAKVCAKCGSPWVRVVERSKPSYYQERKNMSFEGRKVNGMDNYTSISKGRPENSGVGYSHTSTIGFNPTCICNAPTVPGVVLDPFMGSGTVAQVAIEEGRNWLGVELNPDYVKLAADRIEGAKPKPPYEQAELVYGEGIRSSMFEQE